MIIFRNYSFTIVIVQRFFGLCPQNDRVTVNREADSFPYAIAGNNANCVGEALRLPFFAFFNFLRDGKPAPYAVS